MLGRLFGRQKEEIEWMLNPVLFEALLEENYSGKVILPQNCLVDLVYKQIETPYAFKVSANGGISYTHTGVLDFTAEEGEVIIPKWMYEQLSIERNTPVKITHTMLPKGVFIKLLPQDISFLKITNPKRELEISLRKYQVLSYGDNVELFLEGECKSMIFTVVEIQPAGDGISIIDTDLQVDFLPPVGYEEKMEKEKTAAPFLEVCGGEQRDVKEVRMKQKGLFFSLRKWSEKSGSNPLSNP